MKTKIYVIGSVKNMAYIDKVVNHLEENFGDLCHIKHVKPEEGPTEDKIIERFENIDCSNFIIAVSKEDGSYEDGTTYEMMYVIHREHRFLLQVNPTEDLKDQIDRQLLLFIYK